MALNLHEAADVDLGIQVALHYSLADVLRAGAEKISELSHTSLLTESGIKTIAASGIVIGFLGVLAAGTSAVVIGVIGIAGSIAGYAEVEYVIDPQVNTIPERSSVAEVVSDLINGASNALESAKTARTEYKGILQDRLNRDKIDIGSPDLVPGTGYFG
ncbi:hypothetical protein L0U85_17280 [Glycomyces sp. L485]|uniref:hypothetical protein n=1 Tax=Glycomyces sp. L485 TaxID=2909235 RepID=UPI001F4AF914|nr:hypothetical protein [Glycomyces sp. L485]MCH7232592.1 hypothetical protein [Glycomyces sp. L485]